MQRHPQDMEKVELYLSLGSNMGDRRQNLEHALSMLNIELGKPYSEKTAELIDNILEGSKVNGYIIVNIDLEIIFKCIYETVRTALCIGGVYLVIAQTAVMVNIAIGISEK